MNKLGILEGLLFVVGDEGLSLKQIMEIMNINETEAKELLRKLQESYDTDERGIRISFLGKTFKLTTKKEHKEYYQKLLTDEKGDFLSNAALEVLALVAYNEPITRMEIDEARGIASNHILQKLVARDLIKVSGKSNLPGHPNLYKTTSDFLDYFGLSSLSDLPEVKKEENVTEETELFTSIYKEKNE
jgi:segregation and condensation protein B